MPGPFLPVIALVALAAGPARAAHTLSGPFDDSVASYTLVANGAMESHSGSDLSSWVDPYGGTLGYDSRASYADAASAGLLDQTWSCAGAGVALRQSISVTQRADYVISGYLYNDISGGGNAYLDLSDESYAQADGGSGDCNSLSTSGAAAWQFVYCQFTVPAGTHSVTVRTVVDGYVNAGSYAYFDEVALTPAASFTPPDSLSVDDDGDGYSELAGDCDDGDSAVHPGAAEHCGGIDEDCDGSVDAGAVDADTWYADSDGDGYGGASATSACTQPSGYLATSTDCDDSDSAVHPGATEHCDGVDDDCSGVIDDSYAVDAAIWYADSDGDGYGGGSTTAACTQPSGYLATSTDCDDSDSAVHPGATEHCDGVDEDCSGVIDDGYAVDAATWYADGDGDGYGGGSTTAACTQPSGYLATSTDCDDGDAAINPGALEHCDGQDDDCDGSVDEDDAVDALSWHPDLDGDGYGDASTTWAACSAPSGYLADDSDCDDHDAAVNPAAAELCDGYDDDCDGMVDEADAIDAATWYADGDGDGFGDPADSTVACDQPPRHVADDTDCDDTNFSVYPGSLETWYDGIDQDCDGNDDDQDLDGFPIAEDCDDMDPEVHPEAREVWYDGVDQDCDGASDFDRDGDGFDSQSYGGEDCDDTDAATYPGAPDLPYDGEINDCDAADEYDADGDGHDSDLYGGDDCDDHASAVHPGATEVWYDGIDQDCDGNDDDQDGDGWPVATDCDDTDPEAWPGAPGWSEDCEPVGPDTGVADDTGAETDAPDDTGGLPPDRFLGGGGCRCSSGSGTSGAWLLLGLVGLVGLVGLRRRPTA